MAVPIFLGEAKRGTPIYLSPASVNPSVSIEGIAGSGKTTMQNALEIEIARRGGTIIVFNHDGAHDLDFVTETLRNQMLPYYNPIDIEAQGIPLALWSWNGKSDRESTELEIDRVFSLLLLALSNDTSPGPRQKQHLREAVKKAYPYRFLSASGDQLECIRVVFDDIEFKDSSLKERLHYLLHRTHVLPVNGQTDIKGIRYGMINVLNVPDVGANIRDFILGLIWENVKNSYSNDSPEDIYVVLDEYQDLNLKPHSPLQMMLRKGRKYRLGLILTTQTQETFTGEARAVLDNAGTKIYFRLVSKEADRIARTLGYEKREVNDWKRILKTLGRGEFVVTGRFIRNGRETESPQVLHNKF